MKKLSCTDIAKRIRHRLNQFQSRLNVPNYEAVLFKVSSFLWSGEYQLKI